MKSSKTKKSTPQHANQKALKVAVIVVAIIVVLSVLFLLPKKQFAGKAVSFGELGATATAGIGTVSGEAAMGEVLSVPILVNLGDKKSVAASFKLKYPADLLLPDCSKTFKSVETLVTPTSEIEKTLGVKEQVECGGEGGGIITFNVAWLCNADCSNVLTGKKELARIDFQVKPFPEGANAPLPAKLEFEEFKVLDLEDNINLVSSPVGSDLTLIADKESACGNNKLDAGEECDGTLFPEGHSSDCKGYGFVDGTAACKDCKVDYPACTYSKEGEACLTLTYLDGSSGSNVCGSGLKCEGGKCLKEKPPAPILIQLIPQTGSLTELTNELSTGKISANNEYLINVTITPTSALPANHLVLVTANYNGTIQKDRKMGTYPALEVGKTENSLSNTLITASDGSVTFEVLVWSSLPSPDEAFTPLMEKAAVTYAIK